MAEEIYKPDDVYVRKDVFDARMDRLEILIEKNGTELKAYIDNSVNSLRNELKGEIQQVRTEAKNENQQLRTELKTEIQQVRTDLKTEIQQVRTDLTGEIQQIKGDIQGIRSEIRVLTGQVDNLVDVVYWGIGGFGVILAAAVILPTIAAFLKKLFVPSVTLEDVERIVNAAINKHLAGITEGK